MTTIPSKPIGLTDYDLQIEQLDKNFPDKKQLGFLPMHFN
jgi:uncharacterized short protein YbdD (DUF466 family)